MSLINIESIRTNSNPYGYLFNVNHPKVRPLYERYKKWKSVPVNHPLSDSERFEFEALLAQKAVKSSE